VVRLGLGALVVGVGGGLWSERPFMIGLLALCATMLAAEGRLDPRWLLPIGWVWLNSHGSFPLGVVYLVAVLAGERLDGSPLQTTARAAKWLVLGLLSGVINPLGPRLLLFPVELLRRQDVLRHVQEWQAPTFTTLSERIFLLQLGLAILALVRRPSYRGGLVVVVFTVAALLGARNMAVASLVFVPVLAGAWSNVGALRSDSRSSIARALAVVSLAMLVIVPVGTLRRTAHFELDSYPVASLEFLQEEGVDLEEVHLAAPERVGNLLDLRDGAGRAVFFDDRFDMFSDEVNEANLALFDATADRDEVLDRYDISLVLYPRLATLTQLLQLDDAWRTLHKEKHWTLVCRVGDDLGGSLGRC
jgi:hypothetical protein